MTHLDRALQLAADGYPVLPCNASTKAPLIAGGLLAASTDPAAIRAMPWPEPCLVGIRTGSRESGGCGYDVLDVDAAAGGDAWFGEAVRRIPPTRIQQTRRAGGLHLWFEAKPGARCSAGRIAAGVDVRAEHGYVIDWAGEGVPQWLDEPVTPWPAWLGEMVGRRADHGTVDLSDTAAVAAVAPPSVEAVVSLLQRMRNDHGVDRGVWLGVMMAAADCAKITGDEHGAIREAAIEWAARYSGDAEAEEAKWDDDWMSRPVKTGWPGLEHHAVTLLPGYQVEQAAAEFGALPPAPPPPAGRRSIVTPAQCDGISARPYRIKGLLAERDVACLFGPPGAGKSLLGPYIGYRVAVGAECFGMRCKPGSVLYVAAEDESGMERRVAALRGRLGEAEAFGLVRGVSDLNIGSPDLAWLLAEVEARRPALVVIDTLAMAFPGTIENEAESMGRIVAVSRRLTEWGAAVLLIHHSSKAQDGTPRGHSLLNGALDMAIALEGRDDEGVVRGRLTKNRSGGCETVFAFRIGVAELGRGRRWGCHHGGHVRAVGRRGGGSATAPHAEAVRGGALAHEHDRRCGRRGGPCIRLDGGLRGAVRGFRRQSEAPDSRSDTRRTGVKGGNLA